MNNKALSCLIIATVAAPLLTRAQDFTPSTDRILSDPTYLPLAGQIYGQTGYDYGSVTGDSSSAAGNGFRRGWTDTYSQKLAYGVTNRLSLNLGFDYQTDHGRLTSPSGSVNEFGRGGFDNPSFGATYRLIDQGAHPFSLDLKGDIAPDVFPAKTPVGSSDGTVASGGAQGDIGLAIGHETRMFTVQASLTGTRHGGTDQLDMANGGNIHTTGYWVPTLGLATQTRLTPRLSVNVGGAYNFNDSSDIYNDGTGVAHRADRGNYGDLAVAVNYHFIPNRVVGSLGYTHTFYGQTNLLFPVNPALDTAIDRSGNTFGATMRYVFR